MSEIEVLERPKLTMKQRAFIDHYMICKNASKAALLAGYSEKTAARTGSENLHKPLIKAEIERIYKENTMSAAEVLSSLTAIARGDMADFLHPDSLSIDLRGAAQKNKLHLVKKAKYVTQHRTSKDGDDEMIETVEFELYDKLRALVELGKYHQLFGTKITVDDWRSRVIDDVRTGRLTIEQVIAAFGSKQDLIVAFNDSELVTRLLTEGSQQLLPSENS